MTREELEAWASAYINASASEAPDPKDPNWWAIEKAMLASGDCEPQELWEFILLVLARNPPNSVMEVLAAGPLEELIAIAGASYISQIEKEARRNPAFRDLLGGVWQHGTPPDVWARVERARGSPW